MSGAIARFIRALLGLAYKRQALKRMRHPDPTAGMPRSMRGRRSYLMPGEGGDTHGSKD